MRKLVKVSAMLAIATIMQIGGCKLAYAERGYKAIGKSLAACIAQKLIPAKISVKI